MSASETSETSERRGATALFIRRPVLAFVMNLLIIIAGLAALSSVEIRELPDVDRPVVTVRTTYEGATPESIDAKVTKILESAVARVQGVNSITSRSRYGSSRITVEFSPKTNLNVAVGDVRDAVAGVARRLPEKAEAPVVVKADDDASPIIRLAVSSQTLAVGPLTRLVEDRILDRLAAVDGVADVSAYGLQARVIRVAVNQVTLASRGLTMQDVITALANASLDAPSGTLESRQQSLLVRSESPVLTAADIGALFVNDKTRLRDVARVRLRTATPTSATRVDGRTAIGIGIIRQAQSNTLTISRGVTAAVAELQRELPAGTRIAITSDDAVFIQGAVDEVITTLFLATAIVVLVIFLFLRSFRSTMIPAITIPVSILGTIAGIWIAGFSVNILTLLALVLATGIVVDDAIVVLENIQRHRRMGAAGRAAAVLGTREIVFAVISTTVTLAAVFIPISFLPGTAGGLFSEFGFVLAFAVAISSFVALSLGPVLAARFYRGVPGQEAGNDAGAGPQKPAGFWDRLGERTAGFYAASLAVCLRFRLVVLAVAGVFAVGAYLVYLALPQELTPSEDRGVMLIVAQAPQGVNLDYMTTQVAKAERILADYVKSGEVRNVLSLVGRGGANRAFIIVPLADWSKRKRSQQTIQAELRRRMATIPGVRMVMRSPNSLGIRGAGTGLNFAVVGSDYDKMAAEAEKLVAALQIVPGFTDVRFNYDTTQPQMTVTIDRVAARKLGIPIASVTTLIRSMVDELTAAQLFVGDEIIDITVTGGARPVNDPSDVENLFVKAGDGTIVPLSSIVTVKEVAVAPSLGREGQRRAVPIRASLAEDFPLSRAVAEMRAAAAKTLPDGMGTILLGEAGTLEEGTRGALIVFGFAILIVFLVLAAQFESLISAAIIMITVPFGLAAAIYAVLLTGGSVNYYSQIGLVLLVGIMAKNGILIVEFANQLRDRGESVEEAIRNAARIRFRPVMMTMISTVLGGVPLVVSSGAGAEAREALGWIVVGGLGFATLFTLYLTPVMFSLLAPMARVRAQEAEELDAELIAAAKAEVGRIE
ncbi:MAG TPA: efflux RND transporter permease subunit [Alphaproteobacteria bacterium]|nr:efflux RND transporter permease subunit [Alphaproteobacteria bacterium]